MAPVAGAANNSRKRKRSQQKQQYGLDLPEIGGIPVEIVPLHVQALKCCTAYFRESIHASNHPVVPVDSTTCTASDTNLSVSLIEPLGSDTFQQEGTKDVLLDSVWKQMDEATRTHDSQRQQRTERDLVQQRDQAVSSWLNAIHRWLKNHRHNNHQSSSATAVATTSVRNEPEDCSCDEHDLPVFVLQHLLELILCHPSRTKLTRRRASTFLMGHLLLKSAAARRTFFAGTDQDTTSRQQKNGWGMLDWIDAVATSSQDHNDTSNLTNNSNLSYLWQQECHLLLQHSERDYGDLYPTLTTAVLRLEQNCPEVALITVAFSAHNSKPVLLGASRNTSMVERRRVRDEALQHWRSQVRTVTRLVQTAHQCTNILVPRMAAAVEEAEPIGAVTLRDRRCAATTIEATTIAQMAKSSTVQNFDDSDDDSDVDWEEGLDTTQPQEHNSSDAALQLQKISVDSSVRQHAQAVEHTLAAMASAGGLTAGALTIDMSAAARDSDAPYNDSHTHDLQTKSRAFEQFSKVAQKMAGKHQPRLTVWIDALTTSDDLVVSSTAVGTGKHNVKSSLVRMSLEQRRERSAVLKFVQDCQQKVASVLRQAQELGIFPSDSKVPAVAVAANPGPTTANGSVSAATAIATPVPRSGNLDLSEVMGNPGRRMLHRHFSRAGQPPQHTTNGASHRHRIRIKYRKKL